MPTLITGRVRERGSNNPLPYAVLTNNKVKFVTNQNGEFSLPAEPNDRIYFTAPGHITRDIEAKYLTPGIIIDLKRESKTSFVPILIVVAIVVAAFIYFKNKK